jgi:probable F420-dependent oxidoreductase
MSQPRCLVPSSLQFGVCALATDRSLSPVQLAREVEARGLDILMFPENSHMPLDRRQDWPPVEGLMDPLTRLYDPFVALAFAAATTTRLKLGTGVLLVPQRDPIVTAKSVASLDRLSGGRFVFGIGGGWNVEEMANHGARYETRFKLMRERVLAMQALWSQHEASFAGEMVNFERVWMDPKPLQKPWPPVLLGGETDYTLQRVAAFCDGWLPRPRDGFEPAAAMARLRAAEAAAGRAPGSLTATVFRAPPEAGALAQYRAAGIDRVLLEVPDLDRDGILRRLDALAPLLRA